MEAFSSFTELRAEAVGEGPPLFLVGGGLTGYASWVPFLPRLPKGRRLVRLQPLSVQAGLDGAPLPPDYSVQTESRALAAALDRAGARDPADIVAWSFGALVTLTFALDRPERVRSLVLIEPPAVWTLPDQGRAHEEVRQLEAAIPSMSAPVTEAQLERFLHIAGFVPPGGDARKLPQWEQWLGFRQSLRNTPAVFAHHDDLARLGTLRPPVLLLTGTGTSPFLRHIIDTLAARLPNARVVELPAGHAPHIVSADKFLPLLEAFLASGNAAAAR